MYLFSQVNILAKFDHKEIIPARIIAGNKQISEKSISYVLRIQDIESIKRIKEFLDRESSDKINNHLKNKKLQNQETVPLSLPSQHINWNDIEVKKNTYLQEIKLQQKRKEKHVGINILKRDSININGITKKIINGDLLFDPVVEIKEEEYHGEVYDFSVPEAENFIGGFGGIMLHNSGHCGREDLRDLIKMVRPQYIFPAHGDKHKLMGLAELAVEMGYSLGKTIHVMEDGKKITI